MEQNSSYAVVPCYILDDEDLDEGAKNLYARLSMYSKDGRCWPSNAHLAEKHRVSERTIQNWLKQLVDKEYILVDIDMTGQQTRRFIWLSQDFKKMFKGRNTIHPPPQPVSPPPETYCASSYKIYINQQQQGKVEDGVVVDFEKIQQFKQQIVKEGKCTKDEIDSVDSLFTKKNFKEFGQKQLLKAIYKYFSRPAKQRKNDDSPAAIIKYILNQQLME